MNAVSQRIFAIVTVLSIAGSSGLSAVRVPRIWDEKAFKTWATPVGALNVRPGHYTSEEYYNVAADNVRTYPVYPPDKEPSGYWEWLHRQKPAPLVDTSSIHNSHDWISAGQRAFREIDSVFARTTDPELLKLARDVATFKDVDTLPDGSLLDVRWVVTERGLQLTLNECATCHRHTREDKSVWFAGPPGPGERSYSRPRALITALRQRATVRSFRGLSPGEFLWRSTTTPWARDERVERLRTSTDFTALGALVLGNGGGAFTRTNGSPFYGTKVPDLHTTHYSRYLDATGTHKLRGPEDIARYAALVTGADAMEFGPYHMRPETQRSIPFRYADEVLYAIGMYVMSLEPPRNPNSASPDVVIRGERIFHREGCVRCHRPPNYTTGGLTLAVGYRMPANHPNRSDVLHASARTDPGLAVSTRKGTGFYKIPSLRGVWYRSRLMHDGALASLEEMFDPARESPEYQPRGWNPFAVQKRAIPGHPFGLDLSPDEKQTLIAFLRSL